MVEAKITWLVCQLPAARLRVRYLACEIVYTRPQHYGLECTSNVQDTQGH